MTTSEAAHMRAFVAFVKSDSAMAKALQDKNWAGFAKRYNGSGYKKNRYDEKLKTAYDALSPPKTNRRPRRR